MLNDKKLPRPVPIWFVLIGNLFGASKHRQGSSEQDQSEDTTKQVSSTASGSLTSLTFSVSPSGALNLLISELLF